ncbi:hypothetical protein Patl1_22624 [Pistacia atlantica]|uniref:Uncharacterized protein n=1 Tax=Pistacia atlantica TaxID=434234 RepID=A0ACC0ZXF4_9ROSI|nr:hypothetical protein Patl1_22624 [Pistacia atlantica]
MVLCSFFYSNFKDAILFYPFPSAITTSPTTILISIINQNLQDSKPSLPQRAQPKTILH